MNDVIMEVRDLTVAYGRKPVVHGCSLELRQGEAVGLVGANGAGKSTLLSALIGIRRAASGSIRHRGQEVQEWDSGRALRSGVVLCPEGRHLFPSMSVRENLLVGMSRIRTTRADRKERIAEVEALFPVLAERRHQVAGTLSGGEQQMVAIGRALMSRPDVLILDEPSLGLAPMMVEKVFATIERLTAGGTTCLVAEQNVEATIEHTQRVYVMEAGDIIAHGPSEEMHNREDVMAALLGI